MDLDLFFKNQADSSNWYLWVCGIWCSLIELKETSGALWLYWVPFLFEVSLLWLHVCVCVCVWHCVSFSDYIPQALQMWSRLVSQVCAPGAPMQGSSKASSACQSALSRAACFSWSSLTRWCQTRSPCGSPSSAPRKRHCRPSTTSCCWPSAGTTFHWAPATSSATRRWRWSWTSRKRCTGSSSSPWSSIWRLMPPSWPPSQTAYFVDIANRCATACCASRPSPTRHMVWCWMNLPADLQTGEWCGRWTVGHDLLTGVSSMHTTHSSSSRYFCQL